MEALESAPHFDFFLSRARSLSASIFSLVEGEIGLLCEPMLPVVVATMLYVVEDEAAEDPAVLIEGVLSVNSSISVGILTLVQVDGCI